MSSADTRVNDLVVNVMTEEQFEKITPQDNQLYLTPDEDQEWKKPADWIDIRSGALPNSVYFLVGHSADYSQYPSFAVTASISNNGTYDVYVDGIKQDTTAGNTATELNWQTLALTSGYDTTYPAALKTHVVRVTPTSSSNTITAIQANDQTSQNGLLWAHFSLQNTLSLSRVFGKEVGSGVCPILEIVTSQNGVIKTNNLRAAFSNCTALVEIPTIDFDNGNIVFYRTFFECAKLKKLYFRNGRIQASTSSAGTGQFAFLDCQNLKKIETENCTFYNSDNFFGANYALEKLPNFVADSTCWPLLSIRKARSLKDTFLDLSAYSNAKSVNISGESNNPALGWKGLTVSNEAPFSKTTSPQLDVSYTGLDRAALVNLFKSMPYNVGYTVVGSPTITDGVASGFSNDNYLTLNKVFNPGNYNWEFGTKVNPTLTGSASYIISRSSTAYRSGFGIAIGTSSKPTATLNLSSDGKTNDIANGVSGTHNYSQNTNYWIKLRFTGTQYILSYSLDDITYIDDITIDSSTPIYGANDFLAIGVNRYTTTGNIQPFGGSIDLNNTYIKQNGVTWFTGAAAMTKTCSIVGCTGTADLTQEDKNIVLNKGWELTVA